MFGQKNAYVHMYSHCCVTIKIFLQIFTEDLQEVESLPRQKVLEHLRKNAYGLVVPYLVNTVSVM